jgi:S-adenosylmethionine-diacylgycerolhomoserine-N-methlytransferase
MTPPEAPPSPSKSDRGGIEGYYRWHARIYDATRWSFLFGREAVLDRVAVGGPAPTRILEIGCGTGRNLLSLARRFPKAEITGVDLSAAMLAVAARKSAPYGPRVRLVQQAYNAPLGATAGFDLVLCSYALSMFNPGFEAAIAAAERDLVPGGRFALVDFHATQVRGFARWMGVNHVRMDGQLRPILRRKFPPAIDELRNAYGGVWEYLIYVGRR